MNGSPDALFFTDGIDGETHGLLGAINVPGPIAGAELPGLILAARTDQVPAVTDS